MKVLVVFSIICSVITTSYAEASENTFDKADNLTEVEKAFTTFELNTRLIQLPQEKLIIHYATDKKVNLGTELTSKDVADAPNVIYDADPEAFYTLVMLNLDAPSRKKPFFEEYVQWVVVNIPGSKVHKGDTIVDYAAPWQPHEKDELHRVVLVLFKQHHKQIFNEDYVPKVFSFLGRIGFSTVRFALKYHLGRPIAGNFFQIRHDIALANEVNGHHHWTHHHHH